MSLSNVYKHILSNMEKVYGTNSNATDLKKNQVHPFKEIENNHETNENGNHYRNGDANQTDEQVNGNILQEVSEYVELPGKFECYALTSLQLINKPCVIGAIPS